jgi:hypothetical protein
MTGDRRYHFNRYGSYIGYVDEDGRYFLCNGTYRGHLDSKGVVFDEGGKLQGHVDVQGQYWDADGSFLGYLRGPNGLASPLLDLPPPPGVVHRRGSRRTRAHA